jgi:DNA-binding CsgD family transcriptional regulator
MTMTAIRQLISPLLVGRDDLLDLADRRLDEAAAGRGQFLLLAGESGIGKSRLLAAITQKAADRGFRSASGAVARQDQDVPAASILDLARTMTKKPAFGSLGEDLLGLRAAAAAAPLVSRRMLVIEIVDRIVASLDIPTILAFEDLQWADDRSLEIIAELARQTRQRPVLLVGAYRSDEAPPGTPLRDWRSRLLTQRIAEEARLIPLDVAQTALVTTLILDTGLPAPREVVAAVFERTDGIPLHIEELLGAIGVQAGADGRAIREARVPDTIEDAVLERVSRRSPEAQAVARAGAVIGRCFVPDVLAGIMDVPPDSLDGPLQELVDHDVLTPPGKRGLFDFRHQLLRDVLYRSVPASDRRRFHARAGEFGATLEGASEIHASLHYERAGMRPEAFRAAVAGARDAAHLSSHREAFELYRRAVENVPPDLAPEELGDLLHAYGVEAEAIEENEIAERSARRARDAFLAAGRPDLAAEMLSNVLSMWRRQCRPIADRHRLVQTALAELDPLPPSLERERIRSLLLVDVALVHIDALEVDEARVAVQAVRDAADALGDAEAVIDAKTLQGVVEVLSGYVATGLKTIADTASAARTAGYEDGGVSAYREAAAMAARSMAYGRAETALAEGLRYADSIEQSHCAHVMAATSAIVHWARGTWDAAVINGEQAVADRGCEKAAVMAKWPLGYVALGRGQTESARATLVEALSFGQGSGSLELILPALWGLAEAAVLDGDPLDAAGRCEQAFSLATDVHDRALLVPFVVTGVRAYQAAGRPESAAGWITRCGDYLAETSAIGRTAVAHGRGLVALAAGSTGLARDDLLAGIEGWEESGRVWEGHWARLDLANCFMRSNRFAEAVRLAADVLDAAGRLDSEPLATRADQLLRQARGHTSGEERWHPLTAREFEVARLITEGRTNTEIAQVLLIAPRTASSHVEHILAKLGASRRSEIAAWATTVTRSDLSN